jgi:ATP-dependent Zn protease
MASYALEKGELQIQVITIQKREGALGLVHYQEVEDRYLTTQSQILARIQTALAGLVAEEIWFGQTTGGPASDLEAATWHAARYIGLFGMGKALTSVAAAANPFTGDVNPVKLVMADGDRKQEMEELLDDCHRRVRHLLESKRHVVEGIRDALLEREELIGDEIEELMAQLGEREPLPVPVGGSQEPDVGNGPPGNGPVGQPPPPGGIPPGTPPPPHRGPGGNGPVGGNGPPPPPPPPGQFPPPRG